MSARRRWLVAYDICNDGRLRRVHDIVRSHGQRLQYSVFICDLTGVEKLNLKSALRDAIDHRADSIAFIDLGELGRPGSAKVESMGTLPPMPMNGPTIV